MVLLPAHTEEEDDWNVIYRKESLRWKGLGIIPYDSSIFFSGNIFICHKMESDSPIVLEEAENEADWFLSADVMYKIGESVL